MTSILNDYPVRWAAPEVKQLLAVLTAVYREPEVVAIASDAELPIAQIEFDPKPALLWRSVFDVAAGNGKIDSLLEQVILARPMLKVRIDELCSADPVLESDPLSAQDAPGELSWKNFSEDGQDEAVIVANQPTFVDVSFLEQGLRMATGVCRLVVAFPKSNGSGTGFRIGSDLLLTNFHVVRDAKRGEAAPMSVEAWFNYENDIAGKPRKITQISCDHSAIVCEKADDWAVIRTTDPIPDEFQPLAIRGSQMPPVDSRVCIIQHPNGRPKQIAFQHNLVRAVKTDVVQYWTDTDAGSSGSPVFDEQWRVVGLHHRSVKNPNDKTGIRNQGRRIDRVLSRILATEKFPELAP